MVARLLESRGRTDRSVWGPVLSTLVHTTVIAIAVFATAQARVEPHAPPGIIRWVNPRAPLAATPSAPTRAQKGTPIPRALDVPDHIDLATAPLDLVIGLPVLAPVTSGDSEGTAPPFPTLGAGEAADPSAPFSADRVERQAYLESGSAAPRYPHSLRAAGVEGHVTALFVVSEHGRIERGSLRFTRSDNPLFEAAVKDALERMTFVPAEVGGRRVRQLVQMPFVFTLASTEKGKRNIH